MIELVKKDITTVDFGIVAHGVNCQKKMRKGVAGAIKRKWPKVYSSFMATDPKLGQVDYVCISEGLYVANCYTQDRYGYDGKKYADLDAIHSCFLKLARFAFSHELPIYMPKIGCGLGGLDWESVFWKLRQVTYDWPAVKFTVCEL